MSGRDACKKHGAKEKTPEEVGAFERHTKGIGMKLLLKMGYKPGEGLGKDAAGRSEPIQVKLRPRGVGIGFAPEDEQDATEETAIADTEQRLDQRQKQKQRPSRDALEMSPTVRSPTLHIDVSEPANVSVSIQDMRGPVAAIPLKELLHNLTLLRRTTQEQMQQTRLARQQAERSLARNAEETEREEARLAVLRQRRELRQQLRAFVNKHRVMVGGRMDDLEQWGELGDDCRELSGVAGRSGEADLVRQVVVSVVEPCFHQTLAACEVDAPELLQLTAVLRDALCDGEMLEGVYEQLMYGGWWMRHRALFSFHVHDTDGWLASLALIRLWTPLLPAPLLLHFLVHQVIVPRLHSLVTASSSGTVAATEEQVARVLLGYGLFCRQDIRMSKEVFEAVLGGEFRAWIARRIAHAPLAQLPELRVELETQWPQVLRRREMAQLRDKALLPRLTRILDRDLRINPRDQDIEPLLTVLSFTSLIDEERMAGLLADHLLPKLVECVRRWLADPQVDYEEVGAWYEAWKSILPANLIVQPRLSYALGRLLEAISSAL